MSLLTRRCAALISIHPFIKAGVAFLLITTAALFLHPAPSVAVLCIFLLHLLWCPSLIAPALPLLGIAAAGFFGFSVVNILGYGGTETVSYDLGPVTVSREALLFAVSIFLRVFASVAVAILLTRTIHPAHLTAAIDQAAGKATAAGLALLVIHRVIPDVAERYSLNKTMRRIRGGRAGVRGTIDAIGAVLATTIRRAEVLSTAVRSRGYALGARRTAYHTPGLSTGHVVWALITLGVAAAAILLWARAFGIEGFLAAPAEQASGVGR